MGETHIKKKHHNIENALTSQFEVLESQIQNRVGCWDFSWGTGDMDSLKLTWQLKIFVNVLNFLLALMHFHCKHNFKLGFLVIVFLPQPLRE